MPVSAETASVFGYFQNLNLLVLIHDLRKGRTAREEWSSGPLLCPIAHGLQHGVQVQLLQALGHATKLSWGCGFAAQHLGADPGAILRFVRSWDDGKLSGAWLLHQLEELWRERLVDAEAMQALLHGQDEHARVDEEDGQFHDLECPPTFDKVLEASHF